MRIGTLAIQTKIHRATKSCPELVEGNTSGDERTGSFPWAASVGPDAPTPAGIPGDASCFP
jgi:hypothetical protein